MSRFFEETMQGLLEAVEIAKGETPIVEKKDMPAKTYIVSCEEYKLIDEIIQIRKEQNVSQTNVAKLLGVKQQAISRFENKENSPSLKFFCSIVDALGYKIKIEKK